MKLATLSFMLLINFYESIASHIYGGDLTYKCLGPTQYEITYSAYQDCQYSTSMSTQIILCMVSSPQCNWTSFTNLILVNQAGTQVVPSCNQSTLCNGGLAPGFMRWDFKGIVTLPDTGCGPLFLSVNQSSRILSITTVPQSGSYNFFIDAYIGNNSGTCDTSPVFLNAPVFYTCLNQPVCIDPGVFDSEGDSLVCVFVSPMSSSNDALVYDSMHSSTQPFTSATPIVMDNKTGEFCFWPIQQELSVYVIRVDSYRNGIFIGSVKRDIVIHMTTCSGNQPEISGINGTSLSDTTICVNQPVCFDIFTQDIDSTDSILTSWDGGIPGASVLINSINQGLVTFCWTPQLSDIRPMPHCFSIRIIDQSNPFVLRCERRICLTVVDSINCLTLSASDYQTHGNIGLIIRHENPGEVIFQIDETKVSFKDRLDIYDLSGRRIRSISLKNKFVSVSELHNGIYFAALTSYDGTISEVKKFFFLE